MDYEVKLNYLLYALKNCNSRRIFYSLVIAVKILDENAKADY